MKSSSSIGVANNSEAMSWSRITMLRWRKTVIMATVAMFVGVVACATLTAVFYTATLAWVLVSFAVIAASCTVIGVLVGLFLKSGISSVDPALDDFRHPRISDGVSRSPVASITEQVSDRSLEQSEEQSSYEAESDTVSQSSDDTEGRSRTPTIPKHSAIQSQHVSSPDRIDARDGPADADVYRRNAIAVPAVTGRSARYFHKLTLCSIPPEEFSLWFEQSRLSHVHGSLTQGNGRTLNLPHLVLSQKKQKYLLIVNGEAFSLGSGPILRDIRHNFGKLPFSLSIQPHFLQGVQVHEAVLPDPNRGHSGFNSHPEFHGGLLYNVTYEKLLDRSIVMETMLGLHMHDNEKLFKFSGDLLAGYVATQRQLLLEFAKENGIDGWGFLSRDSIEKFLLHPKGAKFAYDIMEYKDAFRAVSSGEHAVPVSGRDAAFIREAQEIVIKITQQNPEIKAVIAESKGTSTETLRMLYGFTSPYVQFLNYKLNHSPSSFRVGSKDLTARFLVDSDFREALVSQTIQWALSATSEHVTRWDADSNKMLLFKAATQNCASNDSSLPIVCMAVPGLLESVLCVVQALKGGEDVIAKSVLPHYSEKMGLIPGFIVHGLRGKKASEFFRAHEIFARELAAKDVPTHTHALIMAQAISAATEKVGSNATMEDHLLQTLDLHTKEHEIYNRYPSPDECVKRLNRLLGGLVDNAVRDRKRAATHVEELVACGVANTIKGLIKNKRCSATELGKVAELASERIGKLLAEKGDMMHEQLSDTVLCNDIHKRHFIPACVININTSPALKRFSKIFEFGDVKKHRRRANRSHSENNHPASSTSDISQGSLFQVSRHAAEKSH
ncbi:MAG: hypothetical protein ACTJLL_02065 [Anaplasma sp.]